MPRIEPVELDQTEGKAKGLLENVEKALGVVPNLMRTLAHSPAALEAYLSFGKALGGGGLSGQLREQIAVAVSSANSCEYCASAHTALGKKLGVDESELRRSLQASSRDPKVEAALKFARNVAVKQGWVGDEDLEAVRAAGFSEGEIVEIVATVGITIFGNYLNHVAQTEVDFPVVEVGGPVSA